MLVALVKDSSDVMPAVRNRSVHSGIARESQMRTMEAKVCAILIAGSEQDQWPRTNMLSPCRKQDAEKCSKENRGNALSLSSQVPVSVVCEWYGNMSMPVHVPPSG